MNTQGYRMHAILRRHARQHQRGECRTMEALAIALWAIPTGALILMLAAAAADAMTGAEYVLTFVRWVRQ